MKKRIPFEKYIPVWLGLAALLALAGCTVDEEEAYGGYPAGGPAYMEIHADSDFYGPLGAYGRWETVGDYGTCWIPAEAGPGWEPYADGSWVSTDGGWYWESAEPWGWATYHYGRWFDDPGLGWCWAPGTQWAPAWVSWCEGDDYVGWAPLPPGGRGWSRVFAARATVVAPRNYVFVPRRQFLDPVRPAVVARYRAATGDPDRFIANVQVNRRGPGIATVERASGRMVRPRPVSEVRRRTEAHVAVNRRRSEPSRIGVFPPAPRPERRTYSSPAVRSEADPRVPEPGASRIRPRPALAPEPIHGIPAPVRAVRQSEPAARRNEAISAPTAAAHRAEPTRPPEKRRPPRQEKRDDPH